MSFTVVVTGVAERGVLVALADMIGAREITSHGGITKINVRDQSELVGVLGRLNDLGVPVDEVLQGIASAALPATAKEQQP